MADDGPKQAANDSQQTMDPGSNTPPAHDGCTPLRV
jgi:hypothetical protein